ncbi:MAG: hypothetical protein LBP25_02395 [Tannerellaceae bacterium]|nr:hypothetical protein [Tannerellaceae bacterium]
MTPFRLQKIKSGPLRADRRIRNRDRSDGVAQSIAGRGCTLRRYRGALTCGGSANPASQAIRRFVK